MIGFLLIAGAAGGVLAALGQLFDAGGGSDAPAGLPAALAVGFLPLSASVLARLPGHRLGRFMAGVGGMSLAALCASSWSGTSAVLAWLSEWLWWPPVPLLLLTLLVFPHGSLPSRAWRPFVLVLGLAAAALTAALAVERVLGPFVRLAETAVALTTTGAAGVMFALYRRWRAADPAGKAQVLCLALGGAVTLIGVALGVFGPGGLVGDAGYLVAAAALPVGLGVAVLRYSLFDLDLLINRSLVWAVMSSAVLAGYFGVLTALSRFMPASSGATSVVTTGLVAAGFEPVRRRVQAGANRVLYGDRADPYGVLNRLGGRLDTAGQPDDALPLIAETVCSALRLPYVGIEVLQADGSATVVAGFGRSVSHVERFPLTMRGAGLGAMIVAPRRAGEEFTDEECRLLTSLARQAAAAVESARLLADLQASRERLVLAREEERRRLRHDLHDGVGPALAGARMQLRAAGRMLPDPDSPAARMLESAGEDLQACAAEVRQVVNGLRPPVLDAGLPAALHEEVRRFTTPSLHVGLSLAGSLDDLPAAAEVATYRIVSEALTNVVRHSGANAADVTVRRTSDGVEIAVRDNGSGIPDDVVAGVGLESMGRRAAELGGSARVEAEATGGTRVTAWLPAAPTVVPSSGESPLSPVAAGAVR